VKRIVVVPAADRVLFEDGPAAGWRVEANSNAESDPYSTSVVHRGSGAHAIALEPAGMITHNFEDANGLDLIGYSHLSFWLYPGEADIQELCVDIGGRGQLQPVKLDLVGDMGLELRGDRWIEVRIPLEDLRGIERRMSVLKVSGRVTGTFYMDDIKLEAPEIEPIVTTVEDLDGAILPRGYVLSQNHPNPFNSATTIRCDLPQAGAVQLSLYNPAGQRIRTLVDERCAAGSYSVIWDGTDDTGHDVASGVYLCRMEAGGHIAMRRLVLIR